MNKTLIQILTENVECNIPQKYTTLNDLSTWNKSNRDQRLSEVREMANFLSKEAEGYLEFLNSTKINGKTLLQIKVEQEIEVSIAQFMGICREQMDTTPLEAIDKEFPFDYDWIQKTIRESLLNISNIEDACLVKENERLAEYTKSEEL